MVQLSRGGNAHSKTSATKSNASSSTANSSRPARKPAIGCTSLPGRKVIKRPNLDYRPLAYCTSHRCGGRHVYAVQTWKKPTKAWPLPKWGKYKRQYIYCCPDCNKPGRTRRMASLYSNQLVQPRSNIRRACRTWNEQLATATVDRIRRALAKFGRTPPFIIPTKSVWGTDRSVTQPFTAQTTQQDKALVSAIIKNNGAPNEAKYRALSPLTPFGALTTSPTQSLATAAVVPQRFNSNAYQRT